ncbi:hypothetical protein ACWEQL_15755 [Kitasatospora sp. NPDC004240]
MIEVSFAFRAALRLYPAKYRRERGEELADVFAEATEGAGPLATVREASSLGAYGLRMSLGLAPTSPGGRIAALAAPMVAGAIAGMVVGPWLVEPKIAYFWLTQRPGSSGLALYALTRALVALPLLLAGAALLGRWTAVRVLAAAVSVAAVADFLMIAMESPASWWAGFTFASDLPFVLAGLLVLAAPVELVEASTRRSRMAVLAAVAGGLLLGVMQGPYMIQLSGDRGWAAVLLAGSLLLGVSMWRDWEVPAAVGLATLPLTAGFCLFVVWDQAGVGGRLLSLVAMAGLAVMVPALVLLRRGAVPSLRGGGVRTTR